MSIRFQYRRVQRLDKAYWSPAMRLPFWRTVTMRGIGMVILGHEFVIGWIPRGGEQA